MIKFLLGEEWLIINYDLSPSHGLLPRVLLCHDAPHCGDSFHHLLHENKKKRKRDKKFCRYKRSSRVYFSLRFVLPRSCSRTTTFDRWKFSNRRFIFEPKARLQKRATWLRRFPNSYDTLETIAGLRESIGIDLGFIEHDRTVPILERYDYALFDSRWNLMDTSKRNKICGNRYR